MEVGIVGLPNVGKSTLFNALSKGRAAASNYPYCTIDPNIAVVEVRDDRLDRVASIVKPKKVTHPVLKFVDIAGLARGASKGEGLGNMFLSHIRDVDAVVHVVRCFEDTSVVHLEGGVDPVRDVEIVETELFLADIEVVDRAIARLEKKARTGDERARKQCGFLKHLRDQLDQGERFNLEDVDDEEVVEILKEVRLLTSKPFLFVANIGEDTGSDQTRICVEKLKKEAEKRQTICLPICAKIEAELAELDPDEAAAFLAEYNFQDTALQRFVRACYQLLQVITFFTIKGEETRGWTVRKDTDIRTAAGKIHTDMYEKFICAEVVSYDDFVSSGGMVEAREKGLVRTEGRDYRVRDGDIVLIKFGK